MLRTTSTFNPHDGVPRAADCQVNAQGTALDDAAPLMDGLTDADLRALLTE